ncbi:MAG TPA: radical SAM/SPASM domain-containing protein [Longimicrobiaceae bacterium]|nr:radical SAM/SPASM domain-containing protein [Longimicrobiaceae bacterium]
MEPHPLRFSEVRVENTNHCGYRCFFCPREQLTRERGFMSVDDFRIVLDRVGDHDGLLDLHGFGEPLLDPRLPEKVALAHERWEAVTTRIISTLGAPVKPEYLARLADSGLRVIEISLYGTDAESYEAVHGVKKFDVMRRNLELLSAARAATAPQLSLVVRYFPQHSDVTRPDADAAQAEAFGRWLGELGVERVIERPLHNFGGGRSYNDPPDAGVCSVAWGYRRRVLQVTWQLDVIPCCFDYNAEVRLGNLRRQSLAEIFSGPAYSRFIAAHVTNQLEEYGVCTSCERCYRP